MGRNFFKTLADQYPFISLCVYANNEYLGVIQNRDSNITTIYDYAVLTEPREKIAYLELANTWWWESNRSVPINIFLGREWEPFRFTLKTFSNKDLVITHGPVCSLTELVKKKSKRRSITLVRKIQ